MAESLDVAAGTSIPLTEIEVRASRSGGPGGQHANVTASRIEAVFDVRASSSLTEAQKARLAARCGPVVTAIAQDTRGQARNRAIALERLRSRIAAGLVPAKRRRATRPTRAARERRLTAKRRNAERKRLRGRPNEGD